jgi:hypothetical protein
MIGRSSVKKFVFCVCLYLQLFSAAHRALTCGFLVVKTMAIKEAQKRHFYNFNLDPHGARHPMLKMYLLGVTAENNAKILGFLKHINDLNAKGTVEQSIIQRIQSVAGTQGR